MYLLIFYFIISIYFYYYHFFFCAFQASGGKHEASTGRDRASHARQERREKDNLPIIIFISKGLDIHRQVKINDKNERFGVVMTPLSNSE